ncbi:MAG: DUF1887 family CARF protein [Pseudomonadota bacterium]|nr:DUF1887 family CARF protein [Pseudomonadota bacterium]
MFVGNILINLVSEQPVPNLIPALDPRFQVSEVVLLVTDAMRPQAKRLQRVCKHHGLTCRIWPDVVPPYDPQRMEDICIDVIESFPEGQSLILNATGGTKVMALAAANLFGHLERGEVIYVDSFHGLIHNLYPSKEKAWHLVPVLGISDYLTSYGMHPKKPEKRWLKGEALPSLPASARMLAENAPHLEKFLGALNFVGSGVLDYEQRGNPWPRTKSLERPFPSGRFPDKILPILEREELVQVKNGLVIFTNEAAARYLSGGWLEEFTFAQASAAGADEVVLSQVVDWETPGEKNVRNEFDCLLIKDNRLFLLECKTMRFAEKGSDVLYKLDSLTESSTGIYGRGALVSARCPDEFMQSRAASRKHRVFGPDELKDLQKTLRQWIPGSV